MSHLGMFLRVFPFILCIILSGCDFHLRGYSMSGLSGDQKIPPINLICPNTTNWQLCQSLRQHLRLSQVELSSNADVELRISPISQTSRVLSIQDNAAAAEYGLSSEAKYQIVKAKTLEVVLERTIKLQHSYRHESTELLAKDRERQELQVELSEQIAYEIFRQLEVLSSKGLLAESTPS